MKHSRSSRVRIRAAVSLLFISAAVPTIGEPAVADDRELSEPIEFRIPAQPVPDALGEFARQAQAQLLFISNGFERIEANELIGTYSGQEGLDRLLEGTGLTGSFSPEWGIKVSHVTASGGAATSPLTGDSGNAGGQETGQPEASGSKPEAQESVPEEEPRGTRAVMEEIVVTGTHIRGVEGTGASVITFSREEIDRTGFGTVEEFFESLPQNLDELSADGGLGRGVSRVASTNNQGAASISLRGLGPGSTLVLVNGKRRPANVFGLAVDVSAIPLAMVERIEVVTSGLSAVYGSDAVAGVVNIVTRNRFEGAETRISYGGARAGANEFEFSQTFGRELDRGSFTIGYTYQDARPLDATDAGVVIAPSIVGGTPLPGLLDLRHASEQHAALLAGRYSLRDNLELYADAHVSLDENTREVAFDLRGTEIGEISVTESDQFSASGGLILGMGARWQLDLSATAGAVENDRGATNLVLPAGSITTLDVPLESARNDEASLTSVSAIFDGPIGVVAGRELLAATGIEFRSESYERVQTDLLTGAVTPFEDVSRDIWAVFGEVHVPLWHRNERRLDLSLAARYESYSDFGETWNPQLGIEWRPGHTVRVHGTYGRSFRAPDLFTLAFGTQVGVSLQSDPVTGNVVPLFTEFGGNPDLDPETADTWTVGIEWEPLDRTSLSLSYFSIEYEDRIDQPAENVLLALQNESLYPELIDRDPTADELRIVLDRLSGPGSFLNSTGIPFNPEVDDPFAVFPGLIYFDNRRNNIGLESTDGLDVSASGAIDTTIGDLLFGLRGTKYFGLERRVTATAPLVATLNQPGKPVDLRFRAHLGWQGAAWSANAYVNYVDSYLDTFAAVPAKIDSWTTLDLSLRYQAPPSIDGGALEGLDVLLSINNALDERPPVFESDLRGLGYDTANANALGRFVMLRVSKAW